MEFTKSYRGVAIGRTGSHLRTIFMHFAIWLLYWLYEFALAFVMIPGTIYWTESLLVIALNIVQFYIVKNWVLPKWDEVLSILHVTLKLLIVTCGYVLIKWLLYRKLYLMGLLDDRLQNLVTFTLFAMHRSFYFSMIAFAFWFYGVSMRSADAIRKKELEKEKLKSDLTTMQLKVLKAQINPHFLFNTLSFVYSKALMLSEKLASGVLTLSEIMRYSIQESDISGSARLADEVRHIDNLILLNRYRFNNEYYISFDYKGVNAKHRIAPFILITLVENAMKYGNGNIEADPITIQLAVHEDRSLMFSIKNRKLTRKNPEEENGIGMQFVKSRLEEFYENLYHIQVKDSDEFYELRLEIELLEVKVSKDLEKI